MDESILAMQQKRFQYLRALYKATNGDTLAYENMNTIGLAAGINPVEVQSIVWYLKEEGLLALITIDGGVGITHAGANEIETALTQPARATRHFPPVTVMQINVQNMHNSQIQQGTQNSTQTGTFNATDAAILKQFVEALKQQLASLPLAEDDRAEVQGDVATIEAQMASSRPKHPIMAASLNAIKGILSVPAIRDAASGELIDLMHRLPI